MATISTAGVIDGQIIYAVHVKRIVDALDGAASNNIIINADLKQGSLTNTTNSTNSHAEGEGTTASGNFSHSEGENTTSSGNYSHAEGDNSTSSGNHSHAEGKDTEAQGIASHAEGEGTLAVGDYSHAEGYFTIAYKDYQTAVGQYNTDLNSTDYFVVGVGTAGNRKDGLGVSDTRTFISNSLYLPDLGDTAQSYVLTFNNTSKQVYYTSSNALAASLTLIAAPPDQAIQFNSGSTFSGSINFLYVYPSHSLQQGYQNQALGIYSHAEGYQTVAAVFYAHAEGYQTLASGNQSHTEGYLTTASANGAHAEGRETLAAGPFSHAEGYFTVASGEYSHAEGHQNKAQGNYSHAEGYLTLASGLYSHAQGGETTASGDYSFAGGYGTIAPLIGQTAVGYYNKDNNTSDYFVVGVGPDAGNRLDGLGVNATRTYISNSLELPNLSNTSQTSVLTYNSTTKQVYYTASTAVATIVTPGAPDKAIQFNSGSTFSGSAIFTFDYTTNRVNLTGSMLVTGSITSSKLLVSASDVNNVKVIGSGSSAPTLAIYGSTGELFTVTDVSLGSLFSVNDISGYPILDVYSDGTVLLGDYTYPAYHTSDYFQTVASGPFKLGAIPTSSYDGGYFECVIKNGVNSRAESITVNWNNSTIVSSSIVTADIGTVGVTLFAALSGSYAVLSGSAPGAGWTIKSIIRAI